MDHYVLDRCNHALPLRQPGRVLICSAGVPHESSGASVVLFYHYIDAIARLGCPVLHVVLLQGDDWPDEAVRQYTEKMSAYPGFTVVAVRSDGFHENGRVRHQLKQEPTKQVLAAARPFQPSLIVALDLLAAWISRDVPCGRRLVWLGDLNFQTIFYHALYAAKEDPTKLLHLPSNWLGCRAWKRVYAAVLKDVDKVIVASHSSVNELAKLGIASEYAPYPWPESISSTSGGETKRLPDKPSFLFFGSLGGLGSRSALHFIIGRVLPRLRRQWGPAGFRILFAGRGKLPGWAEAAIAGAPEVHSLGFVDDLDSVLSSCHAVLVPIDVPVGNRSRILTAMARRALVIAHRNAASGNPALKDGETCFLASGPAEFVDRMRRAVEDRSAIIPIIDRAFQCYRDNFAVEAAGDRLAQYVRVSLSEISNEHLRASA